MCKVCGAFSQKNLCPTCIKKYARIKKYRAYRLKPRKKTTKHQQDLFRTVRKVLNKKYKVMQEMCFDWFPHKRYDICVPELNIIIEYNGIQHYRWIKFFHKTKDEFYQYQQNDRNKIQMAQSYGYKVIVFSYEEDILDTNYVKDKVIKACQTN